MATSYYPSFIKKLEEIFMMDHAELDFGIYRIMNQKRAEIKRFLEHDLLPHVKTILSENSGNDTAEIKARMKEIEKQAASFGVSAEGNPEYQQLKEKLQQSADVSRLENEVYNHLTTFFGRYYDEGDFVSKRRYKDNTYAIPYNGEEVKLHWANADQYYIKSSEYFQNYSFKCGDKLVHFVLKDASTEMNNNKSQNNMERRFALYQEEGHPTVEEVNGELNIYFTYHLMPKATKQKDLCVNAIETLSSILPDAWKQLLGNYSTTDDRSILEKHLVDYTAKNSFDYFIHKDLGGFLRRELDFYIKNEVMHLDDLDSSHIQSQLAQVKAIKGVGDKIITFLASLEDFQKKLWLKKKFVVQTDYCITLDRIPENFYEEICANDAQREEWVRLFEIDKIDGIMGIGGYSEPLSADFLHQNPYLVVDTVHFSEMFKHKLLMSMDDIDAECNGLLINSENSQALTMLSGRYANSIDCVYADPPFNLGENADYLYRVDYKDSTWCTILSNKVEQTLPLFSKDGYIFMRCSHDGNMLVRLMLQDILGKNNYRNEIILRRAEESKGDLNKQFDSIKSITVNYDNLYWFSANPDCRFKKIIKPIVSEKAEAHWHSFWKAEDRPNMRYDILGIDLTKYKGQWMWERNRAGKAVDNYKTYLEEYSNSGISLEDYWVKTGRCLEFVKREGNTISAIKYWIPPREFTMADNNWLDIKGYANKWGFKTENSEPTLYRIINNLTDEKSICMDYFCGSGTTVAVAHKLNRKWIGVEMGKQFDTVILPRMKDVLHGDPSGISMECNWKGGGCFKYIRLEQYEDTLNNLQLNHPENFSIDFTGSNSFKESYMLGYMLDTETKGSLFNLEWFVNPFAMTLKTTKDNELVETKVDMVETFNFLIGLNVETIHWHEDDNICVVEGVTHKDEEKTLVIWRNCEKIDNDALNRFFEKMDYSTLAHDFDLIYVNGDNKLPNLRRDDERWKVVLIEQEFQKRMFEEE